MAAARSPYAASSPVRYANVNANPSYPYPPDNGIDARSFESDSSNNRDGDSPHKRYVHGYGDGQPRAGFDDARAINRTPSPTPSEAKELQKGVFDWERMLSWRYWIRKEWIWYYLAFAISLAGIILFTVYHKQIVNWLMPAAHWMHALPFGWTIPIAVLFVISFPPLFGHEIVAIICGLVWGLGPGFGIVAAGTFLGELGNFYAFKYCCAARGEKLERTKLQYACLARVVRDGGFKIALIARLSAIPGHFTTAVFSTCGMSVITFSIAAILSLPKQFITVYLGVALEQSEDGKKSSKSDTIIKDVVLAATTIITIGAMWYIYHKMNQAKPLVIYDRRKARQAKLAAGAPYSPGNSPAMLESTVSVAFTPTASVSNVDIPLTKYGQPQPQGDIYAPQPRRAQQPGEQQYSMSQYDHRNPTLPPGAGYPYGMASAHPSYGDPFSDSARVPNYSKPQTSAPAHSVSYQRQGPPHGYGSPPPDTWDRRAGPQSQSQSPQRMPSPPVIRHQPPSAPHTPTPRTYPAHQQHQQPPRSAPAPHDTNAHANPFSDPAPAPMPNPYDRAAAGAGHASEASDATFYTAAGAHSRGATFETAYGHDGSDDGHGHGDGDGDGGAAAAAHAHGLRTAPPAYSQAL